MPSKRPSWNEYFMSIAKLVATRSTCITAQVGCVLVRNNRILSTGYNGVPSGEVHCTDQGFCREGVERCGEGRGSRAIHAEINAVGQAAKHGISTDGAICYVTLAPCKKCQECLVASGIARVYYSEPNFEPWSYLNLPLYQLK